METPGHSVLQSWRKRLYILFRLFGDERYPLRRQHHASNGSLRASGAKENIGATLAPHDLLGKSSAGVVVGMPPRPGGDGVQGIPTGWWCKHKPLGGSDII